MIGAAVALGGAYGAHRAGVLPLVAGGEAETQSVLAAIQSRVAGLEEQVGDLSTNQGAEPADMASLEAVDGRIDALEARVAEAGDDPVPAVLPDAAAARLGELEAGFDELRRFMSSGGAGETAALASLEEGQSELAAQAQARDATIAALRDQVGALGSNEPDLLAVTDRIAALETAVPSIQEVRDGIEDVRQSLAALRQTVDGQGSAQADQSGAIANARDALSALDTDLTARIDEVTTQIVALDGRLAPLEARIGDASARETAARALAVSRLKAALDRGAPFETELAAVASALPQGTDLGPLTERAASGVPTQAALTAAFGDVVRAMNARIDQPEQDDVVGRFLSNARSLVSIRETGESDADTPAAALARMEARVGRGDFAAALEAYEGLPDAVQAAGADWVAAARARIAAAWCAVELRSGDRAGRVVGVRQGPHIWAGETIKS